MESVGEVERQRYHDHQDKDCIIAHVHSVASSDLDVDTSEVNVTARLRDVHLPPHSGITIPYTGKPAIALFTTFPALCVNARRARALPALCDSFTCMTGDDPFAALGLPARADLSDDEVRAAWRRLAAAPPPARGEGGHPPRCAPAAATYATRRSSSARGEAHAALTAGRTTPAARSADR